MFPVIASVALFGLYVIFKIFSKDHINLLLTGYFFFLEVLALSHLLSPVIGTLIPTSIPNIPFHIGFTKGRGNQKKDLIDYDFSTHDIICLIIALIIGIWYLLKKHWIANNLFGVAFAVNGVELLHLNNVVTGIILLSGLFIYDVFWVFGTNVMVNISFKINSSKFYSDKLNMRILLTGDGRQKLRCTHQIGISTRYIS